MRAAVLVTALLLGCGGCKRQRALGVDAGTRTPAPRVAPASTPNVPTADARAQTPDAERNTTDAAVLEYRACGCGCCGRRRSGDAVRCVASVEELKIVIKRDHQRRKSSLCNAVGCGLGHFYRVCEGTAPHTGLF